MICARAAAGRNTRNAVGQKRRGIDREGNAKALRCTRSVSYTRRVKPSLPSAAAYPVIEAISEPGGVLGAMDTMYQRGKIQEESMYYGMFNQGRKKHDGSLPLIGVNTFLPKEHAGETATTIELIRSTEERPADHQRRSIPHEPQFVCAEELEEPAAGGEGAQERVCAVDGGGEVQLGGAD